MLEALGLSEDEERVYQRLVAGTSESAEDVATALGLEPRAGAAVLSDLEAKGLVARSVADPGRFAASPPAVALGAMLAERQEALRRAQVQLTALAETYRTGADERALVDVIEVVHGPQAVGQRFLQLQRGARSEVLAFVKASVAVVSPEENDDEDRALERGVTYRLVIEARAFDRAGYFDEVRQLVEAGGACRIRGSVPIRLLVVDRELALLPLAGTDDRGSGALLVHPSGLLDALVALFELAWDGGQVFTPTGDSTGDWSDLDASPLDEVDKQLLTLLFHGLTDQAIGGQLGMSQRTVQRRVRQLMERAGVSSRFQLGHAAAGRRWLGRS
ncbi:helix-turn-helix domain-containing protein [Nocardioides sp. GCM10028917]|uniref:helix-turn-helix domain-containing protein n=1 Tax=Nocardioides sp. GCM10028917 TaxID=3273408 RepID=UPI00360F0842